MMQGQLIKRTHVPKPAVDADGWGEVNAADAPNGSSVLLKSDEPPVMEMYAPEDFVVGGETPKTRHPARLNFLKGSGTALEVLAALTLGFQRLRCRALHVY